MWDVSLGVPVNKLSLLDFSENGNTVTPKQLNKQSVYALFNIYPIPVDLKAGNLRWFLPRAIGGIGLTGRPGENFMVGGAFGLPQIQVFVGSAFANHRIPISGTTPASPLDVKQRYASRLTYGLNVPVLSALEKLKNKK